jgi:adenylyltransferase/sulfurtransferase
MDYDWLCSSKLNSEFEIDIVEFENLIKDKNATIIDVREKDEQPFIDEFRHLQIPLRELMNSTSLIKNDNVIVFCQSGKRSLQAVQLLKETFNNKHIYSLKSGIVEWKKQHT